MNTPTLFNPGPPDHPAKDDAAPLAGGAGVNSPNTSSDSTVARMPLSGRPTAVKVTPNYAAKTGEVTT